MRSVIAAFWIAVLSGVQADAQVNVTQEHNNPSRDGVYVDAAFTPSAAANLTRDLNFNGTISGNVYAQPLYIEGGANGPMIIAVTDESRCYTHGISRVRVVAAGGSIFVGPYADNPQHISHSIENF